MILKIPVLSPIRLYDPSVTFDNSTFFQNPDNRVSHGYDYENVNSMPYALPIPKQWPSGQPGLDFMVNVDSGNIYADLYDSDDVLYKSCYAKLWKSISTGNQWRIWLDGLSGSGITDGYYTVKIFNSSTDALLYESETLIIASWFEDYMPFEFWNFENDFGIVWDNDVTKFTSRMLIPTQLYDPAPTSEKEMYLNDPGILTTLRSTPQRVFNFNSLVVPVHVAELFIRAFDCSELYLDSIHINSEENPEAELIEGSNLKQITGKATFVDFNNEFVRETVEPIQTDELIEWAASNYISSNIFGDLLVVADTLITLGPLFATSDPITYTDGQIILIKMEITDDAGDSDLPTFEFANYQYVLKEWGVNWISFRMNDDSTDTVVMLHSNGQKAHYQAQITVYSIATN